MPQSLQVSLAYRLLALSLMVGEARDLATSLLLPGADTLSETNIVELYVAPPGLSPLGFAGNIGSTNYSFGFLQGACGVIHQRKPDDWFLAQYPVWARTPSLITSNDAYLMASQWLAAVNVDMAALESNYTVSISQLEVLKSVLPRATRDRTQPGNLQKLPVFYVNWGEDQFRPFGKATSPAASVTILGTTKELYELRIGDKAFLRRPLIEVPHAEEIASLPDEALQALLPALRQGLDIREVLRVDAEYTAAVRKLMLEEVNRFIAGLPVRGGDIVRDSDVLECYVRPPLFGFGGNLLTTNYNFRFNERGKLYEIAQRFPPAEGRDDFTLILGTNEVRQLATQWLARVGVNVEKLEETRKGHFYQRRPANEQPFKRAWFYATWGDGFPQDIVVMVDGSSGILCAMQFREDSWLERPPLAMPSVREASPPTVPTGSPPR